MYPLALKLRRILEKFFVKAVCKYLYLSAGSKFCTCMCMKKVHLLSGDACGSFPLIGYLPHHPPPRSAFSFFFSLCYFHQKASGGKPFRWPTKRISLSPFYLRKSPRMLGDQPSILRRRLVREPFCCLPSRFWRL